MTPDRTDETPDDGAENGVLDDSGNLDTTSISILGEHIAQVNVDLPVPDDDDVDDDVVEDEMPIIDPESRAFEVVGIVHLPDAEELPLLTHVPAPDDDVRTDRSEEEEPTADVVLEPHDGPADDDAEVHEAEIVQDDEAASDDDAHPAADADVDALADDAEEIADATPQEAEDDVLEAVPADDIDDVEVMSAEDAGDALEPAAEESVPAAEESVPAAE